MNQMNQFNRIIPAVEQTFSLRSQTADYEHKEKYQVVLFGILRLAIIVGLILFALTAGAASAGL